MQLVPNVYCKQNCVFSTFFSPITKYTYASFKFDELYQEGRWVLNGHYLLFPMLPELENPKGKGSTKTDCIGFSEIIVDFWK